jgi:pyridoxamine 5'-phosphate oxidase
MKKTRSSSPPRRSGNRSLSEKNISADPFDQFNTWFQAVIDARVSQPHAMTLATASADGKPTARMVLLREVDGGAFSFYTNYGSTKGKQLTENPRAALLFYWPKLERQVRIEGTVEKLTRKESGEYFDSRPRNSRIGAWASRQSEVIESRLFLNAQFQKYKQQFRNTGVPLPDFWGGYRLVPSRIEFWQERPNRLHDRILYVRHGNLWKISRLSP